MIENVWCIEVMKKIHKYVFWKATPTYFGPVYAAGQLF